MPVSPDPGPATDSRERAYALAAGVRDPEMPMLTLADLGVLREVTLEPGQDRDGTGEVVRVTITPTYSGCPAMATMRDDLVHTLHKHGFADVRVAVSLHPAWTSDWISERGRRLLTEHGISAPGPVSATVGPVPLTLLPSRRALTCPRCGDPDVALTSEFGPTACTALYRCVVCGEPFQHVKEI